MFWRKSAPLALCVWVLALFCAYSFNARAQPSASATARALFDEGRRLMEARDYAQACPKFEESLRLQEGTGTKFNLADCYEKLGKTASAWSLFLEVAGETKTRGEAEREQVARDRAAALKARLSHLQLHVEEPRSGQSVWVDGVEVGSASWGLQVPVDPGSHQIVSRGPGLESFEETVTVAQAPGVVTVTVPPLLPSSALFNDQPVDESSSTEEVEAEAQDEPVIGAPPPAAPPPGPTPAPSAAKERKKKGVAPRDIVAYSIMGTGVIALVAGVIFGAQVNTKKKAAADVCPTSYNCTEDEIRTYGNLIDDAKQARTLSYVGLGVGVAALGAGTALLLTGKFRKKPDLSGLPPARSWKVGLELGPVVGLRIQGTL